MPIPHWRPGPASLSTSIRSTVAIDGSEDDEINIRDLDSYRAPATMAVDACDSTDSSEASEASDSDSVASLREETMD